MLTTDEEVEEWLNSGEIPIAKVRSCWFSRWFSKQADGVGVVVVVEDNYDDNDNNDGDDDVNQIMLMMIWMKMAIAMMMMTKTTTTVSGIVHHISHLLSNPQSGSKTKWM